MIKPKRQNMFIIMCLPFLIVRKISYFPHDIFYYFRFLTNRKRFEQEGFI